MIPWTAVAAHESDADDDDEPSAHEEIAPEPEAPKSLLPYQVRESAQEMVENQKIMKKLASIDEAEEAKQTAVFSYNVIDITQPPLPFTNLYNPRPLQPTRVVAMRNALIDEGFRVFAHENRIMIVISPSHVDLECITMDPNEEPKQLVLKKPCPLDSLSIIGGQHRQEAVIHIKKEYKKKLANVVTAIERRKTKRSGLRAADSEQKDRLSKQIQELEAERAQYLRSLEFVGPWGVLLLNPGMH